MSDVTVDFDDPADLADREQLQAAFEAEQQELAEREQLGLELAALILESPSNKKMNTLEGSPGNTDEIVHKLIEYLMRLGIIPKPQ